MDFNQFDQLIDLQQMKAELEEVKAATPTQAKTEFEPIPYGEYVVKIERLYLTMSSTNKPMLKVQFRIVEGTHKNKCLFMNQLVDQPFKIHLVNTFLTSLDTGHEVYFDSYSQYAGLIDTIFSSVLDQLEFDLDYSKNDRGYDVYKVTGVYELE